MELLEKGEISAGSWNEIAEILLEDLKTVDIVAAYNAAFDFKKAIPFTEEYIEALYSVKYNEWESRQYNQCRNIARGFAKDGTRPDFLDPVFKFRNGEFPIVDLWTLACTKLINIDKYRDFCLKSGQLTASAQYFKSSAETAFQYLMKDHDFVEDHTALSDAIIESGILAKALKRGAVHPQMDSFPFRNLGTTPAYVMEKRPKYTPIVIAALEKYLDEMASSSKVYRTKMENLLATLEEFAADNCPGY